MNLTCQLSITNSFMTNFVLTNFSWAVPGYAISNYAVARDASSAMVVTNFPTNNASAIFYWVDGASNRVVQVSATINGKTVTGQATFNILKPSADLLAFPGHGVTVDDNYTYLPGTVLHFGTEADLITETNWGMRFYATNIMLNGCPSSAKFSLSNRDSSG